MNRRAANAKSGKRTLTRPQRGSTLGLVALCAFLIIIALAGAFQLMIYLGSSQELKNSVDAASLNVAMRATEIRIQNQPILNYDDVSDCNGKIGLSNINRVWAKAFLVNANEQDMESGGAKTPFSASNAEKAFQNAMTINQSLYQSLISGAAQDVAFNQMTSSKPAKLMQSNGDVTSSHNQNWTTACLYRGEESNIKVDPNSIPKGVVSLTCQNGGHTYMQGYNPMSVLGREFCFTTFHANEAPHLVSLANFQKYENQSVAGFNGNAIPNTFKNAGQMDGNMKLEAAACAVANPMLTYQLQLPRAMFVVSIDNTADWYVQGQLYKHTTYSPSTSKTWVVKSKQLAPPAKGILNGYASLGNEYKDNNIWSAISALPGDHNAAYQKILQRAQEMRPGYSMGDLRKLLSGIPYPPDAASLNVLVYCNDNCTEAAGQLPKLKYGYIYTDEQGGQHQVNVPTFGFEPPDGTLTQLMYENTTTDNPNFCWSNIIGPYPTDKHSLTESGNISWQPGTGWTCNLGVLRVQRNCRINFTGMP